MEVKLSLEPISFNGAEDRKETTFIKGNILYLPTDNSVLSGSVPHKKHSRIVDIHVDQSKAMHSKGIACCVTAYNESGTALLISILGLIRNIQYVLSQSEYDEYRSSIICILVDGVDRMSESFFELAKELGFLDDRCFDKDGDIKIFESYCDGEKLKDKLKSLIDVGGVNDDWLYDNKDYLEDKLNFLSKNEIRIIFYIKKDNAGKLDSHWHFFEVICQFLNPRYCVQMDLGTNPKIDSLYNMLKQINVRSKNAVVACRSMISDAVDLFDYQKGWQYIDMLKERIVSWPIESFLGYLSVMPGQLCLMRWEAVDSTQVAPSENGTFNGELTRSQILESYYRGLEINKPFQANMFLAEDRVLGFEIAHNKERSWVIGYAHLAEAITDACGNLNELVQQRRRWICSSFACQVWFLLRIKGFLSNDNKPIKDKVLMLFSALYFMVGIIQTWFSPAVTTAVIIGLYGYAKSNLYDGGIQWVPSALLGVLLACYIVYTLIGFSRSVGGGRERIVRSAIVVQAFSSLFIFLLALLNPEFRAEYMVILILAGLNMVLLFINTCFYSRSQAIGLIKHSFLYSFFSPWLSLFLNLFAVTNVDNVSWGTKGLLKNPIAEKANLSGERNYFENLYSRFRFSVASLFFVSNIFLVFLLINVPLIILLKMLFFVYFCIIILSIAAAIRSSFN